MSMKTLAITCTKHITLWKSKRELFQCLISCLSNRHGHMIVFRASHLLCEFCLNTSVSSLFQTNYFCLFNDKLLPETMLAHFQHQCKPCGHTAIIWTNTELLSSRPFGTNFSEILIEIKTFLWRKCFWKCGRSLLQKTWFHGSFGIKPYQILKSWLQNGDDQLWSRLPESSWVGASVI